MNHRLRRFSQVNFAEVSLRESVKLVVYSRGSGLVLKQRVQSARRPGGRAASGSRASFSMLATA
jgi:hypothetical protein